MLSSTDVPAHPEGCSAMVPVRLKVTLGKGVEEMEVFFWQLLGYEKKDCILFRVRTLDKSSHPLISV